jgi:hypothetical protein
MSTTVTLPHQSLEDWSDWKTWSFNIVQFDSNGMIEKKRRRKRINHKTTKNNTSTVKVSLIPLLTVYDSMFMQLYGTDHEERMEGQRKRAMLPAPKRFSIPVRELVD